MPRHRRIILSAAVVATLPLLAPPRSFAMVWNNDPDHGVTSSAGLTDMPGYFANVDVITNSFNSTRGTATYLGNGWIITARHVVQGTSYSNLAPATSLTFNVLGTTYAGSVVVPAPDSAEIALVKLQTTPNLTPIPSTAIYTGTSETNALVQQGGFGYWGFIDTPAPNTSAAFHRAYNVAWVSGSFVNTQTDGEQRLRDLGLLEGGGMPGDSGSPLFMLDAPDSSLGDWSQYKLVGVLATSQGAGWGADSSYARTRNYSSLITSLAYGSGRTYNWSRGVAGTFSWNNTTANGSVTNGNNWNSALSPAFPAAAGDIANLGSGTGANNQTINLNQNVTVGQLTLGNTNGGTGTQTLAAPGGYTLTFDNGPAAPTILAHNPTGRADTISAPITIAGNGTLLVSNPSSSPLTLSGPVSGGTLTLTTGTIAFASTVASTLSFTGGTLQYTAGNATDYSTRFSLADNQPFNIDTNGQSVTFASPLTSSGGSLTKLGPGTLTLLAPNAYTGDTNIQNGTVSVSSLASLGTSTRINLGAGASTGTLRYTGPGETSPKSLNLGAGLGTGGGVIDNSGTGLLKLTGANTATGGQKHTLTLQGTAPGELAGALVDNSPTNTTALTKSGLDTWTLSGANTYTGLTTVTGGALTLTPTAFPPVLSAGGTNITAGRLVFAYTNTPSPLPTILARLSSGAINSSTADATHTLGYYDDPATSTVTLLYTLTGDANLDGVVNADDYALLDRGFATGGSFWWQGDFNRDSKVDEQDYLLLDSTYVKQQGGQLSPEFLAQRESQFGPAYVSSLLTSVPEPSLVACGLAFLPLLRRSRRDA